MIKKRRAAHHVFLTRSRVRAALRAYHLMEMVVANFLKKPPEAYFERRYLNQIWEAN